MQTLKYSTLFFVLVLFLVACNTTPEEPVTATTAVSLAITASPAATAVSPTAVVPSPTGTAVVPPPTATTLPTTPPDVTPTATATATPTPGPPAPSVTLEQAPYAASDCSDKYPCNEDVAAWEARIRVPAGFQATYFARIDGQPNTITFGPDGLLYVATMDGSIYTVDSEAEISLYVSGFTIPAGIAFQPGTAKLYVSSRLINQNLDGEAQISVVEDGNVRQLIDGLPCCYTSFHSANGIAFGPDGYGYVGVGARADHGEILAGPDAGEQDELHPFEASVLRFNPDGSDVEVYARGLRNPYDIAWDASGDLYATDNAPDFGPPDELHRVVPGGEHGYPWYECDVCFSPPPDVEVIPPLYDFVPHAAAAGITAYRAHQFPGYFNSLFVALWSAFPGAQKIVRFGPGGTDPGDFATGFAAPIDVTVGPDGALYVADWATGIIFQITYVGP